MLSLLVCMITVTTASFANSSLYKVSAMSDKYDLISLEGKLGTRWPKAPGETEPDYSPISVYKTDFILKIDFLSTLGDIDIAVYDEFGNYVYRSNVNVIAGDETIINISSWADGEYTIRFTNDVGQIMYGTFMILN